MNYFKSLTKIISDIKVTGRQGKAVNLEGAIKQITNLLSKLKKQNNKIILIGNGGSASIASHISIDFLKNAGIPAMTFNEASLLTCISNDLGYEYVFQKPVEMLAIRKDILFAISSSGKSGNILNAAKAARKKGCFLVTLSGFDKSNPLKKLGDVNFYVPSNSYGFVEIIHLIICHCFVEKLIS